VLQSPNGDKKLIAELQDKLDKARETILQLQQLLQAKRGNFYEGIKLTPNQRTVVDMLLMVNGICTKENLYAALYGSKQYKPDAAIIRETLRVIRKQLRPHGIDIKNVQGKGYTIPSKSKIKLRELIIR
jgi:DNA-binding winged helix-turn-helix (wHTH) protein